MPELPEVEAVAISLRPLVEKRKIRSVEIFHPIAVLPQSASHVSNLLTGRRIESVQRKGKYLFLVLDNGAAIEMHFRFDGHLIHLSNAKELDARANKKTDHGVHIDVALELDKGVLAFADGRHLGRVHAWPSLEACPPYNDLGIDAMSPDIHREGLFTADIEVAPPAKRIPARSIAHRRRRQHLLLRSSLAREDQPISGSRLAEAERSKALYKAIVSTLRRALQLCLNPAPDFSDAEWWFQGIEGILRVYQREGEPCKRDGHPIKRTTKGNRSTYFCAHCQK